MMTVLTNCNQLPLLSPPKTTTTNSGGSLCLSYHSGGGHLRRNLSLTTLQTPKKTLKKSPIVSVFLPPPLKPIWLKIDINVNFNGLFKAEGLFPPGGKNEKKEEASSTGFVGFVKTLFKDAVKEASKELTKEGVKHFGGIASILTLLYVLGSSPLVSVFWNFSFLGIVWLVLTSEIPKKEQAGDMSMEKKDDDKPNGPNSM